MMRGLGCESSGVEFGVVAWLSSVCRGGLDMDVKKEDFLKREKTAPEFMVSKDQATLSGW